MKEKTGLSPHETALFYLFTLGGSLFTFGKCGIFCICLAAATGFITLFVFLKLKNSKNAVFLFFCEALCVFYGIYTFGQLVIFIKEKQLFYTPVLFIALIFAAVCVYLCVCTKRTVLKFSLIAFTVSVIFFLLLIFTTVKNADFSDINYALDFKLNETVKVYFSLFFPAVIPVFWAKPDGKSAYLGTSLTAFTLLIFIILTFCTFGKINPRLNSPILALVDTANVGRVFTRLDAFLLSIIYLSCLVRCAVSFRAAYEISAIFNLKKRVSRLTKI